MEISNNYQPNFKSAYITKEAHSILSHRMSSGNYVKLKDEFLNKFKDSDFYIKLDGTSKDSRRLDAIICYNDAKRNPNADEFFEYLEEGALASIFRSPAKFIERIVETYNEKVVPFINNGYKHLS